jgi:cation diffusion facilitator CzcD-associated flavoprotein CzcO
MDIVERFDLRKYIKLRHEVTGAYWNDEKGLWEVHVKDLVSGHTFVDEGEILINGSGLLK